MFTSSSLRLNAAHVVILSTVASDLALQRAHPPLQPLFAPFARARGLVLHHAAVAHVELVLLLFVEFFLVGLTQIVLVLDMRGALGDLSLTLDTVVCFVATGVDRSVRLFG